MTERSDYQDSVAPKVPLVSDTVYKVLRRLVEYIIPGFGTFYLTISEIWGLPYGSKIVATCAALALFVGLCVGIARRSYENSDTRFDGEYVVNTTDPMKDTVSLELNQSPLHLAEKDEVSLKVRNEGDIE